MQAADLQVFGEFDHLAGALDVDLDVAFLVGRHVVQRREVHQVVDRAAQPAPGRGVHAELGLGQVTRQRNDPVAAGHGRDGRLQATDRLLADEDMDVCVRTGQQPLQQVPPDQTGAAGHEIGRHNGVIVPEKPRSAQC